LDQLLADGHATRALAPAEGRGRPAWLWRPTLHGAASPYAALAGVLAETIARTSPDPAATAHEAGLSWGRQVLGDLPARSTPPTPRERVVEVMAAQGFAPQEDGENITLHRCPLLEAADQHPAVVCAVHRGLVDALLDPPAAGAPAAHAELVPFAAPGVCRLRRDAAGSARRPAAASSPGGAAGCPLPVPPCSPPSTPRRTCWGCPPRSPPPACRSCTGCCSCSAS